MIFLVAGCVMALIAVIAWQSYERIIERDKFAHERQQWTEERRELLSRIQAPEAAPFMFETKPEDAEDDLPTLPGFTMSEEELEQAREALEEAGYSEGPVA